MREALWVAAGYAIGTIPTALLVGRRTGVDPTAAGSGNPGASNVFRTSGRGAGALVLVGDLLKGAVAAGAGLAVAGTGLGLACGAAAVVGHVAPLTRLRRGGKGVATAAGTVTVVFPLVAAIVVGIWVVVAGVTRRASLASVVAVASSPVVAVAAGVRAVHVVGIVVVAAVVVARHAGNIRRLVRGEEPVLRSGQP